MTARTLHAFSIAAMSSASAANADFVTPDSYGWSRESENSFYAEWEFFESPTGGNTPDVGMFPTSLPTGWSAPDVVETTGTGFITGGGNIYSFSAPTEFEVSVPNYDLGRRPFGTTVLVQMRTLGSELDYETIQIGGISPIETTELNRTDVGGGFGGALVDVLFRFELLGNSADYLIEFEAAESSMSLDRLSIDTFATSLLSTRSVGSSIRASSFGPVPAPGTACALASLGLIATRRRRA